MTEGWQNLDALMKSLLTLVQEENIEERERIAAEIYTKSQLAWHNQMSFEDICRLEKEHPEIFQKIEQTSDSIHNSILRDTDTDFRVAKRKAGEPL